MSTRQSREELIKKGVLKEVYEKGERSREGDQKKWTARVLCFHLFFVFTKKNLCNYSFFVITHSLYSPILLLTSYGVYPLPLGRWCRCSGAGGGEDGEWPFLAAPGGSPGGGPS